MAIAISAMLASCDKSSHPPADSAQSHHSSSSSTAADAGTLAESKLAPQEPAPTQPSVPHAPAASEPAPSSVIEVAPDSTAPGQAKKVRITRRADGTELERAYLDEHGQEFRSVRNSEDGVVEIARTFDPSGKVVREQVTVNGINQSELRKAAK
jgi:hypothetical protein